MCREVGAASGRGLLAASLFLDLQRCLYSPRTLPELRGLGPRPPGPVHSASVSPRKFGVGSSDCPRGFPEVLSQQAGTGSALRRHRPAKTRAQQQDTKDPQLWRTNLLPRAGPACPACGGANPRLKPWVPTQQGAPSAWRRGVLHPHPHLEQFLLLAMETAAPCPWSRRLRSRLPGGGGVAGGPRGRALGNF